MAIKQHILPLALPQPKNFDNFAVGVNSAVIAALKTLAADTALYLWGNSGSGCSHLLEATCLWYKQKNWHTLYLDLRYTDSLLPFFSGALEGIQLLALDHLDAWIGIKDKEEQLFHLFNRATQTPFAILWSGSMPPQNLDCVLNDFTSRLCCLLVFHVQSLNDLALHQALQQHAKQRGFKLPYAVSQFMLNHYPRNLPELLQLLDRLDQASLQSKKSLSITLLKTLF